MTKKHKKKIILFRHGETNYNLEGRIQGHLDIPLNQTGKQQALSLAKKIKHQNLEIIISSDLARAHETAIIIGKHCNIKVTTTPHLREIHCGVAQGALKKDLSIIPTWKDLVSYDPCYDDMSFEQGETKKEAKQRIRNWLKAYLENTPYTHIGICAHRTILKLLLVSLGYDPKEYPLENAEFVEIEL